MEDQQRAPDESKPTVKFTVLPHPEAEVQDVSPAAKIIKEIATEAEKPPCCPLPMPPLPPIDFAFPQPSVSIDVRDLSATLMGSFITGAAVAFAIAYFSKQKSNCNA